MSSILRQVASAVRFNSFRAINRYLVQDLYIKELKSYKAPPAAKDAHVGSVKAYSAPATPTPPALPTDLASELSTYDATEPTRAAAEVKVAHGEIGAGADAYLSFLEADEVEEEAHH
ncbi:hypothetical protein BV25DRAFT_1918027 [Artomyces pyxidatus]|uniref:Uncharacterized protein n=1 Tax=Artomyces pyxidatus TaxID=48021 RepID=A0ACB8SV96_9AGAM|nr:hypothetical protein BV25DRAFT_1918027 [Artomyces pyxidatus]